MSPLHEVDASNLTGNNPPPPPQIHKSFPLRARRRNDLVTKRSDHSAVKLSAPKKQFHHLILQFVLPSQLSGHTTFYTFYRQEFDSFLKTGLH